MKEKNEKYTNRLIKPRPDAIFDIKITTYWQQLLDDSLLQISFKRLVCHPPQPCFGFFRLLFLCDFSFGLDSFKHFKYPQQNHQKVESSNVTFIVIIWKWIQWVKVAESLSIEISPTRIVSFFCCEFYTQPMHK